MSDLLTVGDPGRDTRERVQALRRLRVALVHDWLVSAGGAERVLGVLHRLFPEAPIYTSVVDRAKLWPDLQDATIRTSFLQRFAPARANFRSMLPLYPFAFRGFDLSGYDLVISSSSAFAKGVRLKPSTMHVCYCYTPMRFAWWFDDYIEHEALPSIVKLAAAALAAALRRWDRRAASRVDLLIAISREVQARISSVYDMESVVLYPPVSTRRFAPVHPSLVEPYFLVVSRLVPYRRVDLAIQAAQAADVPLLIIGDGPDRPRLERLAGRHPVSFLGTLPDETVARAMARCTATVTPGVEDFGLVPLEANAAGRPAIGPDMGGTRETIIDGVTGMRFAAGDSRSLAHAMTAVRGHAWSTTTLTHHAASYSELSFVKRFVDILAARLLV